MDSSLLNYTLIFIILFLIIFYGCAKEKFDTKSKYHNNFSQENINKIKNNNKYDNVEGIYYKIDFPLISKINPYKTNDLVGWRDHFTRNELKWKVPNCDNFDGTITRNYLDNMTFFVN
tara:strand:- start:563 stop:916 length:354 start_codon:yes stop_codon:yes gene_type:complete